MRAVTGHINVARSIFEHPMFHDEKPLSRMEAFLWLISSAAWQPLQVMVRNGRSRQLVNLERGQLTYSRSFLRTAWRWTSDKTVRTFLAQLKREGMIDVKTGQLQTVISICNYGAFQYGGNLTGQQWAGNGPAKGQNKKTLEALETIPALPPPSPAGFDDWYSIYPRKKQPQDAKKAFAKVIASGPITLDALMAKTRAFAASWAGKPKEERQFIPYPASWLNKGSYDDESEGGGEPAPVVRDPRSFTNADWQKRLTYFEDSQTWLAAWGPKPGEPGCLVPPHLILAPVSASTGAA
jgi:hypothetical protein